MNQEAFFDFANTPDPDEFTFWVRVSTDKFEPKLMPKSGVTTFKDFKLPVEGTSMRSGYGDYIYTQAAPAATQGFMRFYFAKPKTEEEKNTPFLITPKIQNFTWDAVLLNISVDRDPGFPQSTYAVLNGEKVLISGARYIGRETYIPKTSLPTKFLVEEFLSPTKFDLSARPAPIPLPVNYSVLGVEREFPECLHDDLSLRPTRTGVEYVNAGGKAGALAGSMAGWNFPKTNFTTWTAHYVDDDQERINGVWHRTRVRVIPPSLPKAITRL